MRYSSWFNRLFWSVLALLGVSAIVADNLTRSVVTGELCFAGVPIRSALLSERSALAASIAAVLLLAFSYARAKRRRV